MKLHYALGIGAVGCPCLGVSAWQIYEEVNPTLGRALWKEGWSKGPISPVLLKAQEVSSTSTSDYLSSENYGCFQWFFPGVNLPESSTSGSSTSGSSNSNLTNPFSSSDSSSSSSQVLGCALMRMVPADSNKFLLKSEITFKNDTQGWAIWTHITNHNTHGSSGSNKVFVYFRILFLGRNSASDTWTIKGGVYLENYGSTVSGNPNVSAPNGPWSNYSKEQHYAGFWESKESNKGGSADNGVGKGLMDEIKLEYGSDNKLFANGDIYKSSNEGNGLTCKGIYDTSGKKWTTFDNSSNCCISNALTEAFKNFKDKKGAWTAADTYCNEVIKVRYKNVDDTTKDRAKGLCYLQTSTPK